MRKRILIVTEEWAGSGHKMAATALKQALEERTRNCNVTIIGGLSVASPLLQCLSQRFYFGTLNYAPAVWEWAYNRQGTWNSTFKKPLGKVLGRALLRRLIEREQPDTVIATHAYCLSGLACAKQRIGKPFRLGSVLTDFHANGFWVHPEIDFYVVAHEEISRQLQEKFHVQESRIFVHGIPIRTNFANVSICEKQEWKRKLGLKTGVFTVLLVGGEGGYGDFLSISQRLLQMGRPLQIVVVTGTNQQLLQQLREQIGCHASVHTLHLLGYVQEMWEWIGAADAVITKPGGLTCAESLAMGTPLLLYQPLPGQERRNSDFLCKQGVAEKVESVEEMMRTLERWQTERTVWKEVAERTKSLGFADAAYRTADAIISMDENRTSHTY